MKSVHDGEPAGAETISREVVRQQTVSGPVPRGEAGRDEPPRAELLGSPPASVAGEPGHHLLVQLGEGGTAQVFLAVQGGAEGVDKLVVLKVLKPSLADNDEVHHMFVAEARFAVRLNHANIVQTIAITQRGGLPAIVMEYLDGQSLSSILSRARDTLPLEVHLRVITDALRGLHHAHELTDLDGAPLHVVHRDVSPQNVFVTYDGQVKLIDFGIAKMAGDGNETATGVIKGKVRYMAPEQIRGQPLDRRVDVYAAGILLWEAATREKMWKGVAEVTIMHLVLNGKIPGPRERNPDVPEELERIIQKALAFDRDDRHPTAADLEADLEAFLASRRPVTSRDLGKLVSREFADVREERRRIVNAELARRTAAGHAATDGHSPGPPVVHDFSHASGTRSRSSASRPSPVERPSPTEQRPGPKGRAGFALAGAALAIVALAWKAGWLGPPPAPEPRVATIASAGPGAPPGLAPPATDAGPQASVEPPWRVAAPPSGAPSSEAPPSSASAPPATAVPIEPLPLPRSFRARRPAAPATPPAAKRDCEPPYDIDADGMKRFRPECL